MMMVTCTDTLGKNKETFTGLLNTFLRKHSVLLVFDVEPNKCKANLIPGSKKYGPQGLFVCFF